MTLPSITTLPARCVVRPPGDPQSNYHSSTHAMAALGASEHRICSAMAHLSKAAWCGDGRASGWMRQSGLLAAVAARQAWDVVAPGGSLRTSAMGTLCECCNSHLVVLPSRIGSRCGYGRTHRHVRIHT